MKRKPCIFLVLLATIIHGTFLQAVESPMPGGTGVFNPAVGWIRVASEPLVLCGPGSDPSEAPRFAMTIALGAPAETAAVLRDGWQRVADGCEMLDDDDEPLGGRVWRRLRVRFATGPMVFAQTAWVGSVSGRTVVAILSAPDEGLGSHLAAAAGMVASISGPR